MKKFRLKPIIIGVALDGFELQEQKSFLFFKFWAPVCGEWGSIRYPTSDKDKLIALAQHLSDNIYL